MPVGRREQLLASARQVFAKKGYFDASIDDVIQKAGVARGTFYNYFDGKRAIFQQVLEDLFEEIWRTVPPVRVGPGEDVPSQVVTNLGNLVALLERDGGVTRILLAVAIGVDPEADRALARFFESCRERLAKALQFGQSLGIVGEGDTQVLAITLMGTLREYWTQRLLGTNPPPLENLLAEIARLSRSGWLGGAKPAAAAPPASRKKRPAARRTR